ncbi:MAG: dihydrolipoyl dehydrogenase [Rhodospirillaceae bacterium]|nr:dihydrolipoyl dehydrogenase [Rhodospirillaceae bacterium]MBT5896718.1 dihydrolipoyl dehydrogenase [Rhodospirillaceae bacterium]MBT6426550.1 dihydrolipoyl dehydrogenase [Rhodospirillaceae bacterium]MBT7757420.1 dihydrolipoyl dehydrogenase [Rhodospirillaceae bacterium]
MAGQEFDLVIIGSGPGGYVAAIRAAQLGLSVAVVERENLGGICLNWGCIPTKALLRSAEVYHLAKESEKYGLKINELSADINAIVKRSRGIAKQLNSGVGHLLKKNKVEVLSGHARLLGQGRIAVEVDGAVIMEVSAKHIILATGARARDLPGMEADGKQIWNYRHALVADSIPKRLLVVGSGAIGIEFASFFNTLGAEVTVVEVLDRVLPVEDEEVSALAHKAFEKQGMRILTGVQVKGLEKAASGVTASIETSDGKTEAIVADRVIMAVGIVGNVEDLGLENTKVKVDRTHVEVDQWLNTGEPGVYAIGDLAGPPWLAHKASHEGVICVEKIAGVADVHPLNAMNVPGCTYCHPQVASVGLTEAAATAAGHKVRVGRFPFLGNGKAIALGDPEGMIKTVFDDATGELLGAHMIGPEVTELIQGYVVARTLETTEAELLHTIFPHPTLSEAMHESVLDAMGRVIHF